LKERNETEMENKLKEWDFYSVYSALMIDWNEIDFSEKVLFDKVYLMEKSCLNIEYITNEQLEGLSFLLLFYHYQKSKRQYIINDRKYFLMNLIFKRFKNIEKKETPTWLELLELNKIKNLDLKYVFTKINEDDTIIFTDVSILDYHLILNKCNEEELEEVEIDDDEPYVDEFELAFRKRKEKQRIFDIITWGIFFLALILSFCFIFFWEIRFIDYIIYITSLWVDVYIVMAINYFKLKDLPRPFLSTYQRTL
jgi:hypothetical protein